MKRTFYVLLLTMIFCIGLCLPVSADMLWEPYDNDYYYDHLSKLDYLNETYCVPEGSTLNMYEDPVKGGLIETLEAGTTIYAGPYGEINGELWACGYSDNWQSEGWFRLNRVQKLYSHDDFYSQYKTVLEQDPPDQLTQLDIDGEIHSWTYPGSGVPDGTIPKEALQTGYNEGVMDFIYVYTDPDGGRWGYVGYFMGHFGWVYLDDPESTEPPLFIQKPTSTVAETGPEADPSGFGISLSTILWAGCLVLLAVAISAAAIYVLKRSSKQKS